MAIGCWAGVDNDSPNGCRIFWPLNETFTGTPSVTEVLHHEGEEEDCDHSPGTMPILYPTAPSPPILTYQTRSHNLTRNTIYHDYTKSGTEHGVDSTRDGHAPKLINTNCQPVIPRGVQLPATRHEVEPEHLTYDDLAAEELALILNEDDNYNSDVAPLGRG